MIYMTKDMEKRLRVYSLIILGCAFLIMVPVAVATSSAHSAAPVTTRQAQTEERPNPVRRFFTWVMETVRRTFRKRGPLGQPPLVVITSSSSLLNVCPPWTRSTGDCSTSREVELSAFASGPANAKLIFAWTVSAGRIFGEGQKVIWDLSNVAEGTYTANVEVNDPPMELTAIASTKVTIGLRQSCFTIESPCPVIVVDCPDNVNESMTFEAHVYGGDPTVKVTYTWSVSAGKISRGQGTSVITVDVSDVTRGSVTATISIGGLDAECVNTASCTTRTAGGAAKVVCPF